MKIDLTWQIGFTRPTRHGAADQRRPREDRDRLQIVQLELPQWRQAIWDSTCSSSPTSRSRSATPDPDAFATSSSTHPSSGPGHEPGRSECHESTTSSDSAKATSDPAKRRTLYNQIQRQVTDDPPYLWLVNTKIAWAAERT